MIQKKKIIWITGDWFMAHDIVLVPLVARIADIHWIILFPERNSRFKESDFEQFEKENLSLRITFLYLKTRFCFIENFLIYSRIVNLQKEETPDIIHLDFGVDNLLALPMYLQMPRNKTIVVLHQGQPHEAMKHKRLSNLIRKCIFNRLHYVKMFSKSQSRIFEKLFPNNTVFSFTLPLIGFGHASNDRPQSAPVRFLSFGTLNFAKNIDLLIDAACLLYERGVRNFKVSINGTCKDWSRYQQRIKYPDVFDLDIRMIDNAEIPNLFNGSHYLVQPYRVVSQSGPMKIAFNYNLPVIVSDLPGFTDEVVEGVNGFCFKCGDVNSLADKMEFLIKYHNERYESLLDKMKIYIQEKYSPDVIVQQYTNMFNKILNKK